MTTSTRRRLWDLIVILGAGIYLAGVLVGAMGCSDGPTAPSPVGAAAARGETNATSSAHATPWPATPVPPGVQCPEDAPARVVVSSHDGSLDIEWSPIPRVFGFEVEVQRYEAINELRTIGVYPAAATASRLSTRPGPGRYQARVRSRGCSPAGVGRWSPFVPGSIDEPRVPSPPPRPVPPKDPCAPAPKRVGPPPPSPCKP